MSTTEETREGFYLGEDGEWIPDGWINKKVSEIAAVIDSLHKTPKYSDEGLPMVRVVNVKREGLDLTNSLKVSEEVFNEFNKRHTPESGDIVFTRVGSYGNVAITREGQRYCLGQNTAIICPQESAGFLFYFLSSPLGKEQIELRVAGSTQKTVSINSINNFELLIPPLREQKAIAAVLGSLDDKIELLLEQNETLEALAQTLFKRWFIDFNFPDENGNPYKDSGGKMTPSELGEIPDGWLEIELGEIVTVKRGGSPRPIKDFITTGDGLRWLKISDASATDSPFIHQIKEKIIKEGLRKTTHLEKGKLVLSNSATPGIPKFLAIDSCIHDGWLHFPEIGHLTQEYLYLLFLKIRPELIQQGNGSVFTNLKTDILKQHIVTIPQKNNEYIYLLKSFSHFFDKIESNANQIQTLTCLRDTILPKLMKGEIRIKEGEFSS